MMACLVLAQMKVGILHTQLNQPENETDGLPTGLESYRPEHR